MRATVNTPEPVEPTVTLELSPEEARLIRDVLGQTLGDSSVYELWALLSNLELGKLREHRLELQNNDIWVSRNEA